jgi:hypothetical protein
LLTPRYTALSNITPIPPPPPLIVKLVIHAEISSLNIHTHLSTSCLNRRNLHVFQIVKKEVKGTRRKPWISRIVSGPRQVEEDPHHGRRPTGECRTLKGAQA